MTWSLFAACGWLVLANVVGMFPSKKKHWPQAYVLIAFGLPLLAWVYWENGVWMSALVLLAACSILRWPVRYLLRWLRRVVVREGLGTPSR
ncbi:MAG: DUF2484 family protein [Paracoccaceae bacterium]|nr:DUF2484 family protein [Paracoccaceae bacterium]